MMGIKTIAERDAEIERLEAQLAAIEKTDDHDIDFLVGERIKMYAVREVLGAQLDAEDAIKVLNEIASPVPLTTAREGKA